MNSSLTTKSPTRRGANWWVRRFFFVCAIGRSPKQAIPFSSSNCHTGSRHSTRTKRQRSLVHAASSPHNPAIAQWVVSGHSLGGALTARTVRSGPPAAVAAIVLIGTTHPRGDDLSTLRIPVTKVYASNDGVAPFDRIQATKHLLPANTRWVEIRGGNHSQFGHYGHQLLDGEATITRAAQQASTRSAILDALARSLSRG